MWDLVLTECHAATMAPNGTPYGAIRDAAIAIERGRIAWIGSHSDLPRNSRKASRRLGGAWVTPGLVDCHTHLVFGGSRAREWEMRLKGASYEDIARAGGGISATVQSTRRLSEADLVQASIARARDMARHGTTTVEIKSGYGLEPETEYRMLGAAATVGELAQMRVLRTFLGAHALPPEFRSDRAGYVRLVCERMIPRIAAQKLADAVDVFCETIAFTPEETTRIFEAARGHGLRVKIHAEQLSDQGGAALAAAHGALSADHLEHLGAEGVAAMARSGTVAVLLPCAFYFLKEATKPPVVALREAGVPIAIATDCNPGTAPVASPLIALNMACTVFGLTPEEALKGMTMNAAKALGLEDEIGTLETGKSADLAIWKVSAPSELAYWIGADLLIDRYLRGRSCEETEA